MTNESKGQLLSAVFVDYDNIYLSLRRKNEEAAKRFSKDAGFWIKEITSGALLTSTNGPVGDHNRRLVMARCYGNPVPRRNTKDNSTDMNSFPFVRHHFLRGGFEVIDCPPLTAQLKNSADIRMVMDMRDLLNHDTYYDEFIILSSDADFTPMLHRLRAHARQTIIYANDYTAAPYTAICDGEVRETNLLKLLLDGKLTEPTATPAVSSESPSVSQERIRNEIIATVVTTVRTSDQPVPLEALAERTTRALGHDQTIGTSWAASGSFLELLKQHLPADVALTDQPPYLAYDARRAVEFERPKAIDTGTSERAPAVSAEQPQPGLTPPPRSVPAAASDSDDSTSIERSEPPARRQNPVADPRQPEPARFAGPARNPALGEPEDAPAPQPRLDARSAALQKSIERIHDASQVPALSPSDYRKLFVVMAEEINENNLQGAQTISNVMNRAAERNVEVRRDDVRFILEVVSEADPWFEQGASANLFAGRFHNFVVARCRSQGVDLSIDDLDLIEAWFAGNGEPLVPAQPAYSNEPSRGGGDPDVQSAPRMPQRVSVGAEDDDYGRDDFPRILQTRRQG